jgi:SAM-dependent methyltransferase
MGTSEFQGKLWGSNAKDWADYGESTSNDLYKAVLKRLKSNNGTNLLDIGCGAGGFCVKASQQGINVSGFDASERLIEIARQRMPQTDFRIGDIEQLPYPDGNFDVVTGFNCFQFAGDIVNGLREAKRVTKKGGEVIAVIWGKPEDCQATQIFSALNEYMPPPNISSDKKPLFTDGVLEGLAVQAGLNPQNASEIDCVWNFKDKPAALRAMLSAGLISLVIQKIGEEKTREIAGGVLERFKQPDGSYQIKNKFKCLVSKA